MNVRTHLLQGHVIPAHPLALDSQRRFSERHQRALTLYYLESGAGGLAVGVHSTQFEIRSPRHRLLRPVLELATRTAREFAETRRSHPVALVAGVCGATPQAVAEAETALDLGYHAALVSLTAFPDAPESAIVQHLETIAGILPIVGFYLQPAVGGRLLSHGFWRRVADIPGLVAIKIAPFNRYQTLDVVRAIAESGRDDVALYTGNDDSIVTDLLTPFQFQVGTRVVVRRIVGGLLGHWGVWTQAAVRHFRQIRHAASAASLDASWLTSAAAVTDMNAALFDAAHQFRGCIPGILEILRRQGLVPGHLCLDPAATLSPGQAEELDRVVTAYPELVDDAFVATHLERWLR